MIANAALRSKFGMKPNYDNDGNLKRLVKSGMGVSLRKLGFISKADKPDMVTFKIDPKAKGFVVKTEPYERKF